LKIISVSLTLSGIIFILASNYIGRAAVCLALVLLLIYCLINIKMTYKYLSTKDKVTYLIAVTASIFGLIKPELTMLLTGVLLMYISAPPYINAIKSKDYSDIVMLIVYGGGILFASYCIINSKAALNTIIIMIGIILTMLGCLSLFDVLVINKSNSDTNEYGEFEDTKDI